MHSPGLHALPIGYQADKQICHQEGGRPRALSDNAPRRVAVMTKAVTDAQNALAKERAIAAEAAR